MRTRVLISAIALAAFLLSSSICIAASDLPLFIKQGGISETVPTYDVIVSSLKPGDTIRFSDGTRITVGHLLGQGNTTKIFEIADRPDVALRIPLYGNSGRLGSARRYITYFLDGAQTLTKEDVPIAGVKSGLLGEYAIVERVREHVALDVFLEGKFSSAPKLEQEMFDALSQFARRTARFRKIGDLHSGQIVYDFTNKSWRLIDWTTEHELWGNNALNTDTIINELFRDVIERQKYSQRAKKMASRAILEMEAAAQHERMKILIANPPAPAWSARVREIVTENNRFGIERLIKNIFSKPYSYVMKDELRLLIERADPETIKLIDLYVFSAPHTRHPDYDELKKATSIKDLQLRQKYLQGVSRSCLPQRLSRLLR